MSLQSMIRLVDPFRLRDLITSSGPHSAELTSLVAAMRYELVPMKGVEGAAGDLPPGTKVSVTCSPVKGIPATIELTEKLLANGHDAVPHLAARLFEGPSHVEDLAGWIRTSGIESVFVIAGDAEKPVGPYEGATDFLEELLGHQTGLSYVGVAGYPDGHAFIDDETLSEALHAKQALLSEAGVEGSVSTQMCFDGAKIQSWLRAERERGMTLPVHLGLPGVVDRARLITMGARLGVGPSLRYLKKNRSSLTTMLAPGGYDPSALLRDLAKQGDLDFAGIHSFTFNSVADTRRWQVEFTQATSLRHPR